MTWDAHQGRGFFGFSTTGRVVQQGNREIIKWETQPRHHEVVDIKEALKESEQFRAAFWRWMQWPDAPPYSGGVLTDWPAQESSALAFAKREWAAVQTYLKSLET